MSDARSTAMDAAALFAESGSDEAARAALLAIADMLGVGTVDPCLVCGHPAFVAEGVGTFVNCGQCGTAAHGRPPTTVT